MAHHASAKKRARQAQKCRLRNRSNVSTMKTAIKKVVEAVKSNQMDQVSELLRSAQSTIAVTCRKGTIHKNAMSRRISRLTKFVKKATATTATHLS